MKKKLPIWRNMVGAVLAIAFVTKTVVDYVEYSPILNSAPFSVSFLANALYLMIPAGGMFAVGFVVKRK